MAYTAIGDMDVDSIGTSCTGQPTPGSDWDHPIDEITIHSAAIVDGIQKVGLATKTADKDIALARSKFADALLPTETSKSLISWHEMIAKIDFEGNEHHLTSMAVIAAYLIHAGRENASITASNLDFAWSKIRTALLSPTITFTISKSAQGFFAVPLWSLVNNGDIEELFRLHVWLPDCSQPVKQVAIHAHQPFAQSWILAGEGTNHVYKTVHASEDEATNAEFSVGWSSSEEKEAGKEYQTHQKFSQIRNTGKLVRIVSDFTETHTRNMSYTIPTNVLHSSEVAPDTVHATFFIFDAHRGFEHEAPVLGPVTGELFTQKRDAGNVTTKTLVDIVDALRKWETYQEEGLEHARGAAWEEGLRAFRSAEKVCKPITEVQQFPCYKIQTLGEIGHIHRMMGRNFLASKTLEEALHDVPLNRIRVSLTGELGVIYRHMNRLEDSRRASEDEYKTAKHLGLLQDMCRALGTLGMVNYQLFLLNRNASLLDLAMAQLKERVEIARNLKKVAFEKDDEDPLKNSLLEYASQREAIGLGRLSLCFAQQGDIDRSITAALEALNLQLSQHDPTKIAFARYFYGHALLLAGRVEEAKSQFNPYNTCTPTIALCKEPSDEHSDYIQEMIQAGADMELRDEQGYSALECAVYSGHIPTKRVVEEGLRLQFIHEAASPIGISLETSSSMTGSLHGSSLQHLLFAEGKLARLRYEANLRKGYRELFQDTMRPILLDVSHNSGLTQLRKAYANALEQDGEKRTIFDGLKVVPYLDFKGCGRIPRSSDGLTTRILSNASSAGHDNFIVFFSYRWICGDTGRESTGDSPDDIHNTQYLRMLRALDVFLHLHPNIDVKRLSIWIVGVTPIAFRQTSS